MLIVFFLSDFSTLRVDYGKKNYMIIPYSVEPILTGQPVLKGLHAIPHGWPLNTGLTVRLNLVTGSHRSVFSKS